MKVRSDIMFSILQVFPIMMMILCSRIPLVGASFVTIPARTHSMACQSKKTFGSATPTISARAFSLCAINGTETSSSSSPSINSDLLIADLVGLLLASQLMGLLDVLNDSNFWQSGGWLQPITLESSASSFSTLTQRFTSTACLYVAGAAFGFGAFSTTPKENEGGSVVITSFRKALRGSVGFFILRVVLAIGMVAVGQQQQELALQDVLRDTYFVTLAIASTRYFVYSFYNRYY